MRPQEKQRPEQGGGSHDRFHALGGRASEFSSFNPQQPHFRGLEIKVGSQGVCWRSDHPAPQKVCPGFSQSQIQFSMEGLGQGWALLLTPFHNHKTLVSSVLVTGLEPQVCPPDHVRIAVHPGTLQSPDFFSQAGPIGPWP